MTVNVYVSKPKQRPITCEVTIKINTDTRSVINVYFVEIHGKVMLE